MKWVFLLIWYKNIAMCGLHKSVSPCYQLLSPDALNFYRKLINQKSTAGHMLSFPLWGHLLPSFQRFCQLPSICCVSQDLFSLIPENKAVCRCVFSTFPKFWWMQLHKLGFYSTLCKVITVPSPLNSIGLIFQWLLGLFVWPILVSNSGKGGKRREEKLP